MTAGQQHGGNAEGRAQKEFKTGPSFKKAEILLEIAPLAFAAFAPGVNRWQPGGDSFSRKAPQPHSKYKFPRIF